MKIRYSLLLLLLGLMISCQTFEPIIDTESSSKEILRAMLESRDTRWTEDDLNIPSENAGWIEIKDVEKTRSWYAYGIGLVKEITYDKNGKLISTMILNTKID